MQTSISPSELFELLKRYPFMTCRLDQAAAELEAIRRTSKVPGSLAVVIFFCCPPENDVS
jgi:hypothetical protein